MEVGAVMVLLFKEVCLFSNSGNIQLYLYKERIKHDLISDIS